MTHDPSRKGFVAKLAGLMAVVGLAPRALAKAAVMSAAPASSAKPKFMLRPDARAVARRSDTV